MEQGKEVCSKLEQTSFPCSIAEITKLQVILSENGPEYAKYSCSGQV